MMSWPPYLAIVRQLPADTSSGGREIDAGTRPQFTAAGWGACSVPS